MMNDASAFALSDDFPAPLDPEFSRVLECPRSTCEFLHPHVNASSQIQVPFFFGKKWRFDLGIPGDRWGSTAGDLQDPHRAPNFEALLLQAWKVR
jgi:hypothetical protein